MNRRDLLTGVAAAGGTAAALAVLGALAPAQATGPRPTLPPMAGRRVIILGAGIAGLVCALELHRAGAAVLVLEAARRIGGRSLTLRAGDVVQEQGGPAQRVGFAAEPHLFFNAGPARIPHHHQGMLGYCRELRVPLQVLVNENRAARVNGLPLGQVRAEMRGVVAELATKALGAGLLDTPLSEADGVRLRAMLRNFGALNAEGRYRGTSRAGWAEAPGMEPGRNRPPLALEALVDPELWLTADFAEGVNYAATMLAPEGGMDRIVAAMAAALPPGSIRLNARVTGLVPEQGRVRLRGAADEVGDVVICALPAPIAAGLEGLPAARRQALAGLAHEPAAKLAVQAPRFWEPQGIYVGISWLPAADITQIWYPSQGFHAERGILTAAYIWDTPKAERFAARSPAERATAAMAEAARPHPELPGVAEHAVSVAWGRMEWARGAWAEWSPEYAAQHAAALALPEGGVHFAGDWLSFLPGWQEGAIASAWSVLRGIS